MEREIITFDAKGLKKALEERAKENKVATSELIRACIRKALKIKEKELV